MTCYLADRENDPIRCLKLWSSRLTQMATAWCARRVLADDVSHTMNPVNHIIPPLLGNSRVATLLRDQDIPGATFPWRTPSAHSCTGQHRIGTE